MQPMQLPKTKDMHFGKHRGKTHIYVYKYRVPKKTHFQNAVGATVQSMWLNH